MEGTMRPYGNDIVIAGAGYHHPEEQVTNEELVQAYNTYAAAAGKPLSSTEFIEGASGIGKRYVRDKKNLLDADKLRPELPERPDEQLSLQAEAGVQAARAALCDAEVDPNEVDAVIMASSHKQRDFPGVSVEIQATLGVPGFAFDMGMACSSATFGILAAASLIRSGAAASVLVISPEIKSGLFEMRDRDSNFIFGEATSALVIARADRCGAPRRFRVNDISVKTQYSNNIRHNRGPYNLCAPDRMFDRDKFFRQNGRAVYRDITRMVPEHLRAQFERLGLDPCCIRRFWLHQANIKMNRSIIAHLRGPAAAEDESIAPTILHEYGNTSSSGCVVTFALHRDDMTAGDLGVLCSFGAGYSIGSVILEKL